ncbi:unnamed protein product, partial [Oppiella nova]
MASMGRPFCTPLASADMIVATAGVTDNWWISPRRLHSDTTLSALMNIILMLSSIGTYKHVLYQNMDKIQLKDLDISLEGNKRNYISGDTVYGTVGFTVTGGQMEV